MKIKSINDVVNNAKFILFPINETDKYKDYYSYNIIKSDIYKLPLFSDKDVLMLNYPLNEHHYKLDFTYNYVMPLLSRLFKFDYDKNDFDVVPNIITKKDLQIDLSYLVPKQKCSYTVKSLEFNTSYNISDNKFMPKTKYIKELKNTGEITEYHYLVPFPHSPFILTNNNAKTDKKLFITGDSQMIPAIVPLSVYYKEIWYYDNRTKPHTSFKETYIGQEFDDILVELYKNPLNKYIKDNIN